MDIYVVDTSALLRDNRLLDKLTDSEIVIHTTVLEELDTLKKDTGHKGAQARKIGDRLYKLRNKGNFLEGVKGNKNIIRFDDRKPKMETYLRVGFDKKKKDNLLLCVAKEIQEETHRKVIFLTGDKFLALKATLDLKVQLVQARENRKRFRHNKGYYNKRVQLTKIN